ncbi:glycosyltransferase family 4 protein [Candidatus Woesearchaeota archaeon]|nr:glycosyltransferase family 4 protein [Candidatus Woesearchaeota archaeon]
MKVYYHVDIEERAYEGRSQMSLLLRKFLEKEGFEFVDTPADAALIHFHSSGVFDSFEAARLKKKYAVPVIYSLYSVSKTEPFNHFRNHLAQRYYLRKRKTSFLLSYSAVLPLWLRGFRLRELDAVITPSHFVKKMLGRNAELIRLGTDTHTFRPRESKNPGEHAPLKVGYFGHPSVYKGVLDFARASQLFPDSCESYVYISDVSERIAQSFRSINPQLNIIGHVKDIATEYNKMDIIALPYRSHLAGVANPLVLLEAMACGKAIITTDFDYLKEIVSDSAVLVQPYSPKQIADAVKKLHDAALRERLGIRAREIAVHEFDQHIMFQKYAALYRRFEK